MERLSVPAKIESLRAVNSFVSSQLESRVCSKETMNQLRLAIEEIFVNIASYAYSPGIGEAEVHCEVLKDPLRVVIQFLDSGVPFDPVAQAEADTSEDALLERDGGLGILLVKGIMDDVQYTYENGKNILTILKRL